MPPTLSALFSSAAAAVADDFIGAIFVPLSRTSGSMYPVPVAAHSCADQCADGCASTAVISHARTLVLQHMSYISDSWAVLVIAGVEQTTLRQAAVMFGASDPDGWTVALADSAAVGTEVTCGLDQLEPLAAAEPAEVSGAGVVQSLTEGPDAGSMTALDFALWQSQVASKPPRRLVTAVLSAFMSSRTADWFTYADMAAALADESSRMVLYTVGAVRHANAAKVRHAVLPFAMNCPDRTVRSAALTAMALATYRSEPISPAIGHCVHAACELDEANTVAADLRQALGDGVAVNDLIARLSSATTERIVQMRPSR